MRIALTRLRTLASFFPSIASGPEWARLKRELKWLNGDLGAARDMDVLIIRLEIEPDQSSATSPEAKTLHHARSVSHRRVIRALQSKRHQRLLQDLARWIENVGRAELTNKHRRTSFATYSAHRLARWHKKLLRKSRRLDIMSARKRHRLRIRTKKLRYAIEIFGHLLSPENPAKQKDILKYLRRAQESLGDLNDAQKARSLMAGFTNPPCNTTDQENRRTDKAEGRKPIAKLIQSAAAAYRKLGRIKPLS